MESSEEEKEEEIDKGNFPDFGKICEQTSFRSENYLLSFFKKLECELSFVSRKELDKSFKEAKIKWSSNLVSLYFDKVYKTNFLYFFYMLKRKCKIPWEVKRENKTQTKPYDKKPKIKKKKEEKVIKEDDIKINVEI